MAKKTQNDNSTIEDRTPREKRREEWKKGNPSRFDSENQILVPGRSYRLVFNDGSAMNITLVESYIYSLIVDAPSKQGGTQRLMVHKHAIKYIVIGAVSEEESG